MRNDDKIYLRIQIACSQTELGGKFKREICFKTTANQLVNKMQTVSHALRLSLELVYVPFNLGFTD